MNDTQTKAPDVEAGDHATLSARTIASIPQSRVSRRSLLGAAGVGVAAVAAGAAAFSRRNATDTGRAASPSGTGAVRFFGVHQAGIATPAQDLLHFAAFDVTTTSRDRVIRCYSSGPTRRRG